MRRLLIAGAIACAPAANLSYAHTVGISRGDYRVSGSKVFAEIVFSRSELMSVMPGLDANRDGSITAQEAESAQPLLAREIASRLELESPSGTCVGDLDGVALTEEDGLSVRVVLARGSESLSLRAGFLDGLSLGHRHLAAVTGPDGSTARVVAYEAQPVIPIAVTAASASGLLWPIFRLGLEHILTGYDHLVFLFGLILIGGRLRQLLAIVTAFTLAHSVTLGLAALSVFTPSPRLVEPAIALSIAYVGIENWFVSDAGHRWLVTFPFGLVHGFGFAGALAEIEVPSGQIPLALASFNVGVEAGQVAVLAAVLPALVWLGRRPWFARVGVKAASAAVALAGLVWFAERLA